jgi:hypothetical protein
MEAVVVRYQTHPDRSQENETLIHAVYDELRAKAPADFRYCTFTSGDGTNFMHLAVIETADGSHPLDAIGAFDRFVEHIRERCVQPPETTRLRLVDRYGF